MKNKGCIGIGCERGTIIIFGAMTLTIHPTRKEDFIVAAGTTGKVATDCELIVRLSPKTSSIRETSMETPGPLMATSNNAVLVGGNDRRGVIEPNVPTCNDGIGTGDPSFTPCLFAATKCPASCNAETARTPKNIGRHNGTAVMSFSFTTLLKKVGFRAKECRAYANVVKIEQIVEKAARDLVPKPRSDSCSGSTSFARAMITGGGVFCSLSQFPTLLPKLPISLANEGRHSLSLTRNNLTRSFSSV
mmetsp:Transcript_59531/g.126553  ORF Transcript_59531/g.126553 Transcript_59531/m.126553 type:complete len:247 (-) Transcript_59531:1341-2081(-)